MSPVRPLNGVNTGLAWGKFHVSQHRQVTYQITHLATLIQKKIMECNLCYLPLTYMMKHVPRPTHFDGMIYAQVNSSRCSFQL